MRHMLSSVPKFYPEIERTGLGGPSFRVMALHAEAAHITGGNGFRQTPRLRRSIDTTERRRRQLSRALGHVRGRIDPR